MIGFGRSDKPIDRATHTYAFHVDAMTRLVATLDLRGVTFFGQDWGGPIGLRVVAENPDRFAAVVVSNTALPTGILDAAVAGANPAFAKWKAGVAAMASRGDMPVRRIIAPKDPVLADAYDAPFPEPRYKGGPLIMPELVPATADQPAAVANRTAWEVFRKWQKPFVTAFGDSDPITRGADRLFQDEIPGAQGQPHRTIKGRGTLFRRHTATNWPASSWMWQQPVAEMNRLFSSTVV